MTDTSILMEPFFVEIGKAPLNIAPERGAELAQKIFGGGLWKLNAVKGSPVAGVPPFAAKPAEKTITVSYSGLAMVWCIALFGAFVVDVVSLAGGKEGTVDIGVVVGKLKLMRFLDYARALRQSDLDWPDFLKRPDITDKLLADINNVFFGAVSWILLHEIAHVHEEHEQYVPPSIGIGQEEEADQFATRWIFDEVMTDREREFRILVVGVALAWLFLFEPIGGDAKHPPAYKRIEHVSVFFNATENSFALEVVCHLFKILFFPSMDPPQFETSTARFDWTIQILRALVSEPAPSMGD